MIIVIFALAIASYVMFIVITQQGKKSDEEFVRFLVSHYNELLSGSSVDFMGVMYDRNTVLKRYRMTISYLVMTSSRVTGFMPKDNAGSYPVLVFLINLFGGWWGIPWGPIRTIQSFAENAGNENVTTVSELLYRIGNSSEQMQ